MRISDFTLRTKNETQCVVSWTSDQFQDAISIDFARYKTYMAKRDI